MAASKNNDMYSYLDQLSTQELESLLQKDAEAPDGGDLDMVMYIMEVIEKREGGSDKEKAAAALEDFFSTYATPEGEGLQLYPSGEAESIHVPLEPEKHRVERDLTKPFSARRCSLPLPWRVHLCWPPALLADLQDSSKWLASGHLRCLPSRMRIRERSPKKLGQMHRSRRRMYNIAGSKMLWRPME